MDVFLRYIGMTADSGELDEKMHPDQILSPIKRAAENAVDSMKDVFQNHNGNTDGMFEDEDPYRPDDPALYDQTAFGDSLMNSIKQTSKNFINDFFTSMFGPT